MGEGRANPHGAPFPSVLFANVRFLETKMDDLNLELAMNKEVRDCCAIILTGTWLKSSIPDNAISMMGFSTFQLDRSCALSGKSCGGDVCIYINERWCTNAKVVSSQGSPDVKCLTVKCRPFICQENLLLF